MAKTKLIFIGGFLGAGKTTMLFELSQRLVTIGRHVALITNDQAPDLVDTALLGHTGLNISEVSGSCFCCDFKALRRSIDKVGANRKKDIIIAEPVGSCTDLTATLIKPIQAMMNEEVSISPLTVLADPARLKHVLDDDNSIHPGATYIIKKQLEESEIIALTKSDLYSSEEIASLAGRVRSIFPECKVISVSAKSGDGIDTWMDQILDGESSGDHILEIDYDRYAEGEAVLGWLNCSADLTGEKIDWDAFTRSFMQEMSARFDANRLHVGHVKMMVERGDRYITSNLTGSSDSLSFRWSAGTGDKAEMIVNARVEMAPEELEELFMDVLRNNTAGKIIPAIKRLRCISPGYPKPTYRFGK